MSCLKLKQIELSNKNVEYKLSKWHLRKVKTSNIVLGPLKKIEDVVPHNLAKNKF